VSGRGVAPGATILLVENEPSVRTGMMAVLTGDGFNVSPADHPDEVWTALETRPEVQVLLTDLDASGGTEGLEVARRVHDCRPSLGLVITSGRNRQVAPDDVPGNGCFIPHPIPPEILLQEVKLVSRREQVSAAEPSFICRSPRMFKVAPSEGSRAGPALVAHLLGTPQP
jgi:two-component system, response regulator PdtaR